jgi:hypothetical protein
LFAWGVDESESEATFSPINEQYTLLFDHIYDNYNTEFEVPLTNYYGIVGGQVGDAIDLNLTESEIESNTEESINWMREWKIRNKKSDDVLKETYAISAIKSTVPNEKVGKIVLKQKHIYLAKCTIVDDTYPIAIYGDGQTSSLLNILTKREVSDIDVLADKVNIEHIYCDDALFSNYLVIAFYEKDKAKPTMMIQVLPTDNYSINDIKETWLKYLGIYRESIEEKTIDEVSEVLKVIRNGNRDDLEFISFNKEYNLISDEVEIGGINYSFIEIASYFRDNDCSLNEKTGQKECSIKLTPDLANEEAKVEDGNNIIQMQFGERNLYYEGIEVVNEEQFFKEFYVKVKESEFDELKSYLFSTFMEKFKTSANQAIKNALTSAKGETAPARCNVGTRAVFYYYTDDPVLFPKTGGCLDDTFEGECNGSSTTFLKGQVDGNGNANTMARSLEDGLGGFTPISDVTGHDYPDFAKMQEDVNDGAIIIGAYENTNPESSGHVCMLMPENMDETISATGKNKVVKINGVIVHVPVALECGSNFKKIRRLTWAPSTLKEVNWYKYNKR